MPRLALIGDHDQQKTAHAAIPRALDLAGRDAGIAVTWEWIGTARVGRPTGTLAAYDGIWVVPGSPYKDMAGRWPRSASPANRTDHSSAPAVDSSTP